MIKAIEELQKYRSRLTTVLNELSVLEDWENVDYSECATDIGFHTVILEQRRERLQRRGITL